MGRFQAKWSREQKDAVASAVLDRGLTQKHAYELARTGNLAPTPEAAPLPPYDMPLGTIASLIKDERKRRRGTAQRPIEHLGARDAVELLRLRLVRLTDSTLERIERRMNNPNRAPEAADAALLRECARLVREIQSIPGRHDTPLPKPGALVNGKQPEGPTRTGLGADILRDAGRNTTQRGTAPETPLPAQPYTEDTAATDNADDAAPRSNGAHAAPLGPGSLGA